MRSPIYKIEVRFISTQQTELTMPDTFSNAYHFYTANAINARHETIILLHGLMRTGQCMKRIGQYLNSCGYDVIIYQYASTRFNIHEHSQTFQDFLSYLSETKKIYEKLAIIAHSLGGIIARHALSNLDENLKGICQKLIMLAPPNQGSYTASITLKIFPFLASWIKPLPELCHYSTANIHNVSSPESVLIGILAAKFDAKVRPHLTHLPDQTDHICINSNHMLIINHPATKNAIKNFLDYGHFN